MSNTIDLSQATWFVDYGWNRNNQKSYFVCVIGTVPVAIEAERFESRSDAKLAALNIGLKRENMLEE